jgi:predicted transposase/invertase (TIGR01784 family)
LLNLNPQTLQGEIRELYGHQLVCLNPNHPNSETPKQIRDWLDLIYQSIHSPERPVLNTQNEGIKKAMELISFENLTPEERTNAKNKEAAKIVLAKTEQHAKQENTLEIAKKLIKRKLTNEEIAEDTGLTVEQVEQLLIGKE